MKGATWLVTGGTGSFGQAFTRSLLGCEEPASIRILSRHESLQASMRAQFNDPRLRFLLGDVRDSQRLLMACKGVQNVVQAAALKRIEVCESDPNEAVATNIQGTQNVAQACLANGVRKAVFLSTDKACAPDTLYGATKQVGEKVWLRSNVYAAGSHMLLSATRYGNVLHSTGSVVPTWRQQALSGSITVTDSSMTRFVMTMQDAVGLVMTAFREMQGGEIFLPKLRATSVHTLAQAVAPDVPQRVIGLRAGEKIHEQLVSPDEVRRTYDCGEYFVIVPDRVTWRPDYPTPSGTLVPPTFTYTSDTVPQLSIEELRGML